MMQYSIGDILQLPRHGGDHYTGIVLSSPNVQYDEKIKSYWIVDKYILDAKITDPSLFLRTHIYVLLGDVKAWVDLGELRRLYWREANIV